MEVNLIFMISRKALTALIFAKRIFGLKYSLSSLSSIFRVRLKFKLVSFSNYALEIEISCYILEFFIF